MAGIPRLAVNAEVERLAEQFIREGAVPETAAEDAIHIALAAVHRISIWSHGIAAISIMPNKNRPFEQSPAIAGHPCPEICTPEELMEDFPMKDEIIQELWQIKDELAREAEV